MTKYAKEINGVIQVFEKLPEPYITESGASVVGLKYSAAKQEQYGFYPLIDVVLGKYQTKGEIYFSEEEKHFTYRKVDMSEEEIAAYELSLVPQEITLRQLKLQMLEDEIIEETILTLINSIPDETEKQRILIEWQNATTFSRTNADLIMMWTALGYTDQELNEFFINAFNK